MKHGILGLALAGALGAAPTFAINEFDGPLTELAHGQLAGWLSDPAVVSAVKAQNARNMGLSQSDVMALDEAWRAEVGAASSPMITQVLERPASLWLRERKEASAGLVTEVFLMDAHGLNVAQSDTTSDLWQGDEDKFQKTFGVGPAAVHISEIELDESTQTYQSQVSLPILDPATGQAIGAATFGIDVSMLD
jgi:hypothetical protein